MIVWVVALRAEAQPLVAALGLRAHPRATPWPLYLGAEGAAGEAALVVSGIGRTAAAAAAGWAQGFLAARGSDGGEAEAAPTAAWINAGIAGHAKGPVGRALLAHCVVDVATQRSWYPPPVPGVSLETETVFTVDRPETVFEPAGAYDMEAAGFLAAASRCATAELAQVVKVVSDTPEAPPTGLGRSEIGALMTSRLDEILSVAGALAGRGAELEARRSHPAGFADWAERWRFSTTQRRQLRRLLERRAALAPEAPAELPEARDGRSALAALARMVRRLGMDA